MAGRLLELARLFAKLGAIGFGGPAAHLALMEDEVVERRGWLTPQQFLDLVGATNLIPGPNSTEMAIHIGFLRAGWPGLLVAGASFVCPAVLVTGVFAWLYVRYGRLPAVEPWLFGIKPAVLAIIVMALARLWGKAVKGPALWLIAGAVAVAVVLGVGEIPALLAGGVVGMLWLRRGLRSAPLAAGGALVAGRADALPLAPLSAVLTAGAAVSLPALGLFFLKIGSVLYGGGYVLVAFLQGGLVERLGWLTQRQLLDAVAVGQFTPGPILSTATFVGYLLAGWPGALVSTVAVFLPSFGFVAALNPIVPKLRHSVWAGAFLDAVNASTVALMVAVVIELGWAIMTSWAALAIALASGVVLWRWRVNPAWVVLGAALVGALC